jgi:TRAP-type C4-dicarboxylate transport system substrate-binding protein
MGQFNELMNVYTFPYLFKNADHFWETLSGDIGRELFKGLEGAGVYGFAYFDAGTRDFFTDKPVRSIEDLAGLKVRSMQNEICIAGINALGASAVPMGYSERYSATKTGVVNGAENNPPTYLNGSMYEVAPYYIHDEHVRIPDIVIGSKIALDKLSNEDLQAIIDAGVEAEKIQRELWDASVKEAIEKAKSYGATFYTPTEADFTAFRTAVQPVYDKYGDKYQDIINRIRTLGN